MATFSHVTTKKHNAEGRILTAEKSYSGDGELASRSVSIPTGETKFEITWSADVDKITSIWIHSDQVITINTNDGDAPVETLVMKAGVPYEWNTDSYDTLKFSTDITALFIANASGETALLDIEGTLDSSPGV